MDATNTAAGDPVPDDREWSLVAFTHNGKVSILKNLDTYTARETYKKLKPDECPKEYIWPACGQHTWSSGRRIGGAEIDRVEIIGPAGQQLDPWQGVAPTVMNFAAEHEMDVQNGYMRCSTCSDPEKLEAAKEKQRRKDLLEAVPLAFWLEDSHAC